VFGYYLIAGSKAKSGILVQT